MKITKKILIELLWLMPLFIVIYICLTQQLPFDVMEPTMNEPNIREIDPFDIKYTIIILTIPSCIPLIRYKIKWILKNKKNKH